MSLKEKLLDLFFPPRCAFCRRTGVHGVCADCERTLPYAKVQLCEGAGFGRCASPLLYEDAVRESLLRFKFHGAQSAAEGYGELLARCAAEELGGQFDTVTWVPVSKKREHERGYDQAYLLAKETARHWVSSRCGCCGKRETTPRSPGCPPPPSGGAMCWACTRRKTRTGSAAQKFCSSTIF